ncbi:MAG: replication initiator protein [Chaetfec virus UA24_2285]|nr:MAG: replication initiator protein [Chaetfec virus UA24_2285]
MVTLTYDNYERDSSGRLTSRELPPDRSLHVCKRDCQLFIKRLRKRFGSDIKYIIAAEYGSRTHRAHYHCILFGVKFPDMVFYKKSTKGSTLYKSKILTSLWGHGICTIDSVHIGSAVAHYCTKYCMKNKGVEDTFMLFSQRLGLNKMLEEFNGLYYTVEGRNYPIPRSVWQVKIAEYLLENGIDDFDYRYLNRSSCSYEAFKENKRLRKNYCVFRDCVPMYQSYLEYWSRISAEVKLTKPPVFRRIIDLPQDRFAHYKEACLNYLSDRSLFRVIPRSSAVVAAGAYDRACAALRTQFASLGLHLPYHSCLDTASDTKTKKPRKSLIALYGKRIKLSDLPASLKTFAKENFKKLKKTFENDIKSLDIPTESMLYSDCQMRLEV